MAEKSLKELLGTWQNAVRHSNLPQPPLYEGPDIGITRLTEKTSEVDHGACFVARVRETSDGHPYIGKAIDAGATMILAQQPSASLDITIPQGIVYLQVADTALTLAWLAAAWHDFPSHELVMIGITGTDGKTSTANILFSVLKAAELRTGLLSTIKAVIGDDEEPLALHVTTPEAQEVQRQLRRMADAGVTHCVLEATSHGLAQYRVGAIEFDMAVITNITHEHLDYHGDYESYFSAKARLFDSLNNEPLRLPAKNRFKERVEKAAVLNRDDGSYEALAGRISAKKLSYGFTDEANVRAREIRYSAQETAFELQYDGRVADGEGGNVPITSSMSGEFNVYNMLAAATVALGLGLGARTIQNGIQSVSSVSGRMERIDSGQPFLVLVDFAHTPNALQKAIQAARLMTKGRVITVFGSAGKRDVEKRRLMAENSVRLADLTVLTAEDPRTDDLDDILSMMAEGCSRAGGDEGETFWRIADRGQAIYFALRTAEPGDTVLICGKGHEQSMCFGTVEYPWDDRQATRIALDALMKGESMPDLGLPTFSDR